MTLRSRITSIERLIPQAHVKRASPSPLPQIIAAVEADGGRLPGESWADACARFAGTTARILIADLKDRSHV